MKCKNCKEKMEYDNLASVYSKAKLSIMKKNCDSNVKLDDSIKTYFCPNCGAMCIKYMTWFD
jgi:predicted RNA-binding Zn-ribbon protein involved in translation (DUF1610 family)